MLSLRDALARVREYDEIARVGPMARRYFAMNAFDGVVTIIGVLAGAMAAKVTQSSVVIVTGLATALAMGISGFFGAYLTEAAERRRDLADLESQTLRNLASTRVGRANRFAVIVVTVVDGASPMLAAVIVLSPFLLRPWLPGIAWAYRAALIVALVLLFALGGFLGHISRHNKLLYGIKTTLAGVIAIAASQLVGLID